MGGNTNSQTLMPSQPVRKHLLLVEDDPIILSNVSSALEEEGFDVTQASTLKRLAR